MGNMGFLKGRRVIKIKLSTAAKTPQSAPLPDFIITFLMHRALDPLTVSFHEAISLDLQSFIPMALENSPWKQTQRNFAQRLFSR